MTDAIHPDTDIQAEETPILTLDPFAQVTPGLEPAGEEAIVPVQLDESTLTPAERKMVDDFARTIDVTDTGVILQYGAAAQQKVAGFSETALQNVRTKDMGEVGEMLTNLVGQLRTITDEDEEKGFFGFFRKAGNKVSAMKAKYDKAETNVEKICTALENHQVVLMKDIATLDELYKLNLTYFKELSMYILAGKKKLGEVRATDLPALQERPRPPAFRRMPRPPTIWTPCVPVLKRRSTIWS